MPLPPLVWATRPLRQNDQWAQRLKAVGEVVEVSLLDIQPLEDTNSLQAIKSRILKLDEYAHVIFVSQNAVYFGFDHIHDYWPQLPVGIRYYGVGKKTAAAIANKGVEALTGDASMDSEALLSLPELHTVDGDKILIFRGRGGRPKLADVLTERGAKVDYCELYERILPKSAAQNCAETLAKPYRHIVPMFSGDTLKNFLSVWPVQADKQLVNLIFPAQHVATHARSEGFEHVWIVRNASEEAMLETIKQAMA